MKTMRMARMIMRMARMIMRMIKAMKVSGVNIIITIKLRIIRIASDNNNYKNENQYNDDRKVIMTSMIMMMTA